MLRRLVGANPHGSDPNARLANNMEAGQYPEKATVIGKSNESSLPTSNSPPKQSLKAPSAQQSAKSACQELDDIHLHMDNDDIIEEQKKKAKMLEESLRSVRYKVQVTFPQSIAGNKCKSPMALTLDALTLVGEVQAKIEQEMFGCAGKVAVHLTFHGHMLPPDMPVHFAGIRDGDILAVGSGHSVLHEEEDYEDDDSDSDDSFDDALQNWAARR